MAAAIRPAGKPEGTWALPKGLIGLGEKDARKACTELQNQSMPCMAFKASRTLASIQVQ